ncbi:MAG: TatD family deoxyribonuclease [Deltaproteobacteria bacterium]|nr:TatD family deoxyribonuclease [Deltaproteobacteria bacterium]
MSKKKAQRPDPASLGLPLGGADSHAHLDMGPLVEDLDSVLTRARTAGVARIGQVFLGPGAYENGRSFFDGRDEVFFLMGIHPHDAESMAETDLDRMALSFRSDFRLRALGEIGLDFHYDYSPRPAQKKRFRDQLALARELDMPVVIHSREAEDETLAILMDMGFPGRPLLWHCFGQGPDLARTILGHGWDISIPGPVTYQKNELLASAVAVIPPGRLHLETDCPYLAPEPYQGKTNEPALAAFTALAVANIQKRPPAEVWISCGANTTRFFGL